MSENFEYSYSAERQSEIDAIRKKYLPADEREEKLAQLRRLDASVTVPGFIASTALGILLGMGTGSLLGYRVICLLESSSVRFMHGIQWEAWALGALITVVYAALIHVSALRRLKDLKLTDLS